ncbi:MAG: Calx-beta domain-containing protein, partial [Acidobacteriota bacterium]
DETFTVDLGGPSLAGITVGAGGVGTILNDDSASVSINDVVQLETDAATTFTFTVSLTGEVAEGFGVPYATADGTATVAGGDYGAASGVLTFTGSDGEGQTVEVMVLGDEVVSRPHLTLGPAPRSRTRRSCVSTLTGTASTTAPSRPTIRRLRTLATRPSLLLWRLFLTFRPWTEWASSPWPCWSSSAASAPLVGVASLE